MAVGNARRAQASHATRSTWSSALKIDATITQLHQPAAHHQHLVGAASQSVRSRALHAPARAWSAASTAHPKARARSPESSKKRLGPKTTHNTGPLSDKTLRVPPKLIQERQLIHRPFRKPTHASRAASSSGQMEACRGRRGTVARLMITSLHVACAVYHKADMSPTMAATDLRVSNSPMSKHILTDAPAIHNARCLDGSPPGYYMRYASAPENATKYVVYFQGGGWCTSAPDCHARAATSMGSSLAWPDDVTALDVAAGGGVLSPDEVFNPDFASWNAVFVAYCDGGSFSGDRSEPTEDGLWFRGRAIMTSVVADLLVTKGMQYAEQVLMTGGSAGGLTVALHADYFRSLLPSSVRFGAMIDAGWFDPGIFSGAGSHASGSALFEHEIRRMAAFMNATSNAACEAAYADDKATCMFAMAVFPYLQSDTFVSQSAYDSFQLLSIDDIGCATYGDQDLHNCSAESMASIDAFGKSMRESIKAAMNSSPHHSQSAGCFVSACITHVQNTPNEGHDEWDLQVAGRALRDVVRAWFFGPQGESTAADRLVVEDCAHWPCNPDPRCVGFTRAQDAAAHRRRTEPEPEPARHR